MRLRHSSSPMGSTGSSNESWPSSKDEDMTEVYSHHNSTNAKHAKTSDSSEPDDVEEPNESWNEVSSYTGVAEPGGPGPLELGIVKFLKISKIPFFLFSRAPPR